jgi:hypothetical protein
MYRDIDIFQEGGQVKSPDEESVKRAVSNGLQDRFRDVNIFDNESRLARITEGLEPGSQIIPVEPTPAQRRVGLVTGGRRKRLTFTRNF